MPDVMLLGEAWGEQEEQEGRPFVGASGWLLNSMLEIAGISRQDCFVTNVFNLRPRPKNDVISLCGSKAEAIPSTPTLTKGKYVRAEFRPELDRLYREIERENPNVIVALGATAAWALLGTSGIRKIRGAATTARGLFGLSREFKVVPTYHPAAILRDYSLRPITISDLAKAKRESGSPALERPRREIWVEPNLSDLSRFEQDYILKSPYLSVDIETIGTQITCIGFAPSVDRALVVPFYDARKADGNYWPNLTEEMCAWHWVRRICALRKRLVFQNGLYDIHFLWKQYGIPVPHAEEDTMLLHHALQPEMEKGLGFLGSVYTDEAAWKFMRVKHESYKKED